LRRIGRNHLDVQIAQGAAHLGRSLTIHRLSGFRGQPEMASAIAV
jgi:hypothetical protein